MVASITSVSGTSVSSNIADLSTAIFAASDNADEASLFGALVAAAAQGEDGSQPPATSALLGALPNAQQTFAPPLAAWAFPLRLPSMPEMANPVSLLSDVAQIPAAKDEPGSAPALMPFVFQRANISLSPGALEAIAPTLVEGLLPSIALPARTPAPPGEDGKSSTAPSSSPPELEPPQAAATNALPVQLRFALANIPGAPALIVRNIIFAQMPALAQGDENAASDPSASGQAADNAAAAPAGPAPPIALLPSPVVDITALEVTAPAANAPAAQAPPALGIAPAQLPEPAPANETAAPAPPATGQVKLAPKTPSNGAKTAMATKPADGNQKDDKISDGSPAITLAPLAVPVLAPPPESQPVAPQPQSLSAAAIDTGAPSNDNSAAPAGLQAAPVANAAPLPIANTPPQFEASDEEISPQGPSAAPQVSNGTAPRPQQTRPSFRIGGAASQPGNPAGVAEPELPSTAQAAAKPAQSIETAQSASAPEAAASDATAIDSGDTAKSAGASASAPNAKPAEHAAAQSSADSRSNVAAPPPPPAMPQIAAAPLNATVHAASDNPPPPIPAIWAAAAGDSAEIPVRVSPIGLSGLPDTTMFDALALKIAAKSSQGDASFQIRLDPPELGRIEVNLSVDANGNAGASLTADKPQTLDLLQRDSGSLERALKDAGLDLTGGLSFSLKSDARSGSWRDAQQGRSRALAIGAIESTAAGTIGTVLPAAYGYGANGRLDITV